VSGERHRFERTANHQEVFNAGTIEPHFATPERQSKLDPFADKLAGWLKTEGAKSRKQRRTLKQMHADLVVLGFEGSYGRVAAFARDWRADRQLEQQTTGRGTDLAPFVSSGRGIPVRLERGFCRSGRRAHQAASCAHQAVAQPCLSGPGVSSANARPSRDISCGNALPINGCCSMPIGTGSGSSAASWGAASMTARILRHWSKDNEREDGG